MNLTGSDSHRTRWKQAMNPQGVFCANPACALHVRVRDAAVEGGGNWLTLPDGRVFGRGRFGDALLCDACGTRRGPITLAGDPPQENRRRVRQ